jgi:hypothetical protein
MRRALFLLRVLDGGSPPVATSAKVVVAAAEVPRDAAIHPPATPPRQASGADADAAADADAVACPLSVR